MKHFRGRQLLGALTVLALTTSVVAVPARAQPHVDPGVERDTSDSLKPKIIGTEHAPVDGRDGVPHAGPWVETSAERERRKSGQSDGTLSDSETTLKIAKNDYDDGIPQSNEGVMDDKSRSGPVEGTRGTEGGITEKSKLKPSTVPVKPETPKEKLPLPHSEKENLKSGDDDSVPSESLDAEETSSRKLLEKPTGLPEKPYNGYTTGGGYSKDTTASSDEHSIITRPELTGDKGDIVQPLHSLFLAFTMILFSEIGDKTFLVACLMAMRHDRLLVFTAAFSALITMTVLSAVLGHAVPTLIPKWLTNYLAAALFLVFGVKMLLEARNISPDEGVSEEMKEVEQELEEKEHEARRKSRRRSSISPYVLESGRGGIRKGRSENGRLPSPPDSPISEASSRSGSPSRQSAFRNAASGINNLFSFLLSPAWVQTFVMTFLGEWGDRSQIATIAMAAGSDYWWVTAGALGGHAICTGVAVIGGKAIAGKVSLRTGKSAVSLTRVSRLIDFSNNGWCDCLPGFRCSLPFRSRLLKRGGLYSNYSTLVRIYRSGSDVSARWEFLCSFG